MSIPIIKKAAISTSRLVLKPYTEADADALADLLMNSEITETFMVPEYASREEYLALARKLIAFSSPADTVHFEYGIFREDRLIGFINECGIEGDTVEVGYVIDPSERGRGYAAEALTAAMAELKEMGFAAVRAGYFEQNTASLRVMEKCGMHRIPLEDEEEYRGHRYRCLYCEKTL